MTVKKLIEEKNAIIVTVNTEEEFQNKIMNGELFDEKGYLKNGRHTYKVVLNHKKLAIQTEGDNQNGRFLKIDPQKEWISTFFTNDLEFKKENLEKMIELADRAAVNQDLVALLKPYESKEDFILKKAIDSLPEEELRIVLYETTKKLFEQQEK